MPPKKMYDEKTVGENAQNFYNFLDDLWNESRIPSVRDDLMDPGKDESQTKYYLQQNWQIVIPANVRLVIFDIATTTTRRYNAFDPASVDYYVLILPPRLSREVPDQKVEGGGPTYNVYKEAQAMAGAWFHATNDGYGM